MLPCETVCVFSLSNNHRVLQPEEHIMAWYYQVKCCLCLSQFNNAAAVCVGWAGGVGHINQSILLFLLFALVRYEEEGRFDFETVGAVVTHDSKRRSLEEDGMGQRACQRCFGRGFIAFGCDRLAQGWRRPSGPSCPRIDRQQEGLIKV